MKRLAFMIVSWIGTRLSHGQRRFLLDGLGIGRVVGKLAENEFGEVALPNGVTIAINPLLHGHVARNGKLVYEEHVLRTIENHLAPGNVFYDVGANIGVFSFIAACKVGEKGGVHAFEPEENNLACFQRTLERLGKGNIVLHRSAVGPADGSMTFDRRGGAFSGRLVEPGREAHGVSITVEVRSIDSLVTAGLPAPSLIKIDVEGGEGGVLEGMRRTLKQYAPIILCELHSFNPDGVRRTLDVLAESGYRCRSLDGDPIAPDRSASHLPGHILAMPAHR